MSQQAPWYTHIKELRTSVQTHLTSGINEHDAGDLLAQLPILSTCRRGQLGQVLPSNTDLLFYWSVILGKMEESMLTGGPNETAIMEIPIEDMLLRKVGEELVLPKKGPIIAMFTRSHFIAEYFRTRHSLVTRIEVRRVGEPPRKGWFGSESTEVCARNHTFHLVVSWAKITISPHEMEKWNVTVEPPPIVPG